MSRPLQKLRRFFRELKRRNVYQVAATYAVVGFVLIQVADLTFVRLGLPSWTVTLVIVLVAMGFPLALVLAWAFERTPEGVRRTPSDAEAADEGTSGAGEGFSTGYKLLVGLGLVAAAVAGGWYLTGGGGTATPDPVVPGLSEPDSTRVAVFPFGVRGGEDLEHWGEGMVELLARSLDGAGSLKAVDPNTLLGRLSDGTGASFDPDTARLVAARLGAGKYVQGRIYQLGDSLRLSATWYRIDGGEIGTAEVTGSGEGEIQGMVDALARAAIAELVADTVRRRQQLAAQTTSSARALKSYLEGQRALRRYEFGAAIQAFSQAVERDSAFALAHYRLSMADSWESGDLPRAHRAARRAVELSDELPRRDRLLLRAYAAYNSGRAAEAERLYRTLRQRNPGDAEVAYMLGETHLHFNAVRGRPVTEAQEPFRAAMRLDPTFHLPLLHLVHLAILTRDTARLDSLTRNLASRPLATQMETILRAIRAYLLSGNPGSAIVERLREEAPLASLVTHVFLFLWDDDRVEGRSSPIEQVDLSRLPDEARAALRLRQAEVLVGRGRLQAARRVIEEVAARDSAAYWMGRGEWTTLPFVPDGEQFSRERTELRRGLDRWDASAVPQRLLSHLYLLPRDVYPAGRLYLRGLLAAADGDWRAANRTAARLDSTAGPVLAQSAPADFARSVRAAVNGRQGRPEPALAHLRAMEHRAQPVMLVHPLLSGARERYLRARLLEERGRYEEALTWYGTFGGLSWGEVPYLAPAHFGRARSLAELGRREEAARAYRRGLDLWDDADSVLQPTIRQARKRLQALTAGTGERAHQ